MDDPLRLTVGHGKLFARIEAQRVFSTRGLRIAPGVWHHVAAVKSGSRLTLYLDGRAQETIEVPAALNTAARVCAEIRTARATSFLALTSPSSTSSPVR